MKKVGRHPVVTMELLLLAIYATSMVGASQEEPQKLHALLPESWARKSAITKVMPTYPEEQVRQGVFGLVHIKFETNPEGDVLRIKVKPQTNPQLTMAVAQAVKHWKFKPWPGPAGISQPVFSRLIFDFRLTDAGPLVELYNPGSNPSDHQQLSFYNSAKEKREWKEWDDVAIGESTP